MFSVLQRDIPLTFLNAIHAWVGDLPDIPADAERDP
jgi:hypothetical protein